MKLPKAVFVLLLVAAVTLTPLWAVTTDELLKKVTILGDQVAALQTQVNQLSQQLAQQQAVVKISGGNVTVATTGTLDLKGSMVRLNGGGKPVLGGVVNLPSGAQICTAATSSGSAPCLAQGTQLATGSPTVFVP